MKPCSLAFLAFVAVSSSRRLLQNSDAVTTVNLRGDSVNLLFPSTRNDRMDSRPIMRNRSGRFVAAPKYCGRLYSEQSIAPTSFQNSLSVFLLERVSAFYSAAAQIRCGNRQMLAC